ncbi:LacI family DNA-binding transcriptional regulator [Salipaludibacillus sp. CF4.18]|uniref:LacI family DNA-binding transcriptional regulator n=1 Tax=Salipaludibacillus sp. CF4.18 TaxID=3373081 RepID=UPI003EE500F6
MRTITIADVAKHSNVSKSTVSQYLNKRYEYMGEGTKTRIEEAIKLLGYRPNIVARSLKQKSTTTIGVIVANILHTFSTQVIRAIEDICHDYDFHTIVCNADDDPEKEKKYIEMLQAKQVDGIIIFPTGGNVELFLSLKENDFPLVFMDRFMSEVQVPSVVLDNEKASKLAVDYFVDCGYQRIGIMTTSILENLTTRIKRVDGYRQALQEQNIPINENYIKSLELHQFEDAMTNMLTLKDPPQAILAGNDLALMEILKFTKKKEISIPKDLALIGIDDVSFASFYNPGLTTVAQPAFEMGEKAAELLLNKIQKKEEDVHHHIYSFEPQLIKRESC